MLWNLLINFPSVLESRLSCAQHERHATADYQPCPNKTRYKPIVILLWGGGLLLCLFGFANGRIDLQTAHRDEMHQLELVRILSCLHSILAIAACRRAGVAPGAALIPSGKCYTPLAMP